MTEKHEQVVRCDGPVFDEAYLIEATKYCTSFDGATVAEIDSDVLEVQSFGSTGERPESGDRETSWTQYLSLGTECPHLKGTPEFRTIDGSFVDIVTDDGYAVEVEWFSKWKEAIGQSLYYALLLNKKPKIVFLSRSKKMDKTYYLRTMVVATKLGIEVEVVKVKSK